MARLIDADELNWRLGVNQNDKQIFYITGEDIDAAPTIDPESLRPHGRWIFHHMTGSQAYYARCSECRKLKHFASENDEEKERYCSRCGARMEKDKT